MPRIAIALGLAMSLAGAFSAAAQQAATAASPTDGIVPIAPAPAPAAPNALGDTLKPDDLASRRGGESTVNVTNLQNLTATAANNSITADAVDTGDVSFDSGAMNGFSGVGNFVVNTGANSNVLGSLSVTIVTAAPAP